MLEIKKCKILQIAELKAVSHFLLNYKNIIPLTLGHINNSQSSLMSLHFKLICIWLEFIYWSKSETFNRNHPISQICFAFQFYPEYGLAVKYAN